jgi:hypothetical protein
MRAVIVTNPDVFDAQPFVDLFRESFANPRHSDADEARAWCRRFCENEYVAVLVALEDGEFHGLAVCERPIDGEGGAAFAVDPWLGHVWSRRPDALAAMKSVLLDWLAKHDHDGFRVINLTGHAEAAYKRWLEQWFDVQEVGMVYACKTRSQGGSDVGGRGIRRVPQHEQEPQPDEGHHAGGVSSAPATLRRRLVRVLGWPWRRVRRRARRPDQR